MSTQEIVQLVPIALALLLLGVGVALVLAVRILNRLSRHIEATLAAMRHEATSTLQQAHATLERVERLALSSDQVLHEEVTPTLEATRAAFSHVETTTRGISETVSGVQRVVKGVAAMSGSGALAVVTQRVLKNRDKLGIVAVGLGAGLRAFFGDGDKQSPSATRSDENGTERR